MPSSPIRKLAPLANEAKRQGVKVYHLNIGQPDLPTPQKALDALKQIDRKTLEYSPSEGFIGLREKLVGYYAKFGINDIVPENIIVTAGGSEGILLTFLACMNPGDEMIMVEPGYANYISFAVTAGIVVKTVTSYIEDGFKLPPMEAFEEVITSKTRAILLCNPGNPTGAVYSPEDLRKIKELVLKYDLYLISDEVYREFVYTDEPYVSVMSLGIPDNAILIDETEVAPAHRMMDVHHAGRGPGPILLGLGQPFYAGKIGAPDLVRARIRSAPAQAGALSAPVYYFPRRVTSPDTVRILRAGSPGTSVRTPRQSKSPDTVSKRTGHSLPAGSVRSRSPDALFHTKAAGSPRRVISASPEAVEHSMRSLSPRYSRSPLAL